MCQSVDIPTQLIIEHGATKNLEQSNVLHWFHGRHVAVICGNGKTSHVAQQFMTDIQPHAKNVDILACKENTLDTVNALEREVLENFPEIVVGVGGGKVTDVAKVIGTRTNLPVVLVPTAISNDAICSPVAVIHMNKKTSLGVKMPQAVIIDLDILALAPERLMTAGIGDLLSNRTALFDWELAQRKKKDAMNTFARLMANNAIESFMNTVSHGSYRRSTLMKVLAESLVMSGIAMSIAGSSRPCSGSEHLISHALDYYCGGKALHGEQVAIGILIAEYLQNGGRPNPDVQQHFEALHLPTHYSDLGYTREEMTQAIRMAPTMRTRYTILNEFDLTDTFVGKIIDDVFPERSKKRIISFA